MRLLGKAVFIVSAVMLIGIVAGCGGKADNSIQPAAEKTGKTSNEPVTLVMTAFSTSTNEAEFNDYMKPNIEKKYPNITLKWVQPQPGAQLEDQIAAGQTPDIIATGYASIPKLRDLDIALNLNDLIKKNGFNLGVFEPVALQSVKIYGENGEIFALPYTNNYFAAFYNKDVFDRFAMPYQGDNLTWDQMLEITHKIDQLGGGDSYRGMIAGGSASLLGRTLALSLVDPKTDKAQLNNDSWLKIARLFKGVYPTPASFNTNGAKGFLDGKVGVFLNWGQATINQISTAAANGTNMNWDMASYPHYPESKGAMEISTNIYVLSKTSKNMDAAFQVISYLTSSSEVQSSMAAKNLLPVVKVDNVDKVFGKEIPILNGKNVGAILNNKWLDNHLPSRYDPTARNVVDKYINQYIQGQMDERTALAKAEEETNSQIADLKGK